MLIPFPIAFFVFAFLCDLAFWRTGDGLWATAALWLLGAGLIMAALAAIFGLIDFLGEPRIRALQAGRVGTWSIAIAKRWLTDSFRAAIFRSPKSAKVKRERKADLAS